MSTSWEESDRYLERVAACDGHQLEPVSREQMGREHDFRPWLCSKCRWRCENIEKVAYEQGFKNGWDQAQKDAALPDEAAELAEALT